MTLLAIFCLLVLVNDFHANAAFVDPDFKLVDSWTGWGTSLAWFSDMLGGFDKSVQDKINYDLFSVFELFFRHERKLCAQFELIN